MTAQAKRTETTGPAGMDGVPPAQEELVRRLLSGDTALARRQDLGELHKRLVTMIASMTDGLGEAQSKRDERHEAAIGKRFDELEQAVNGLESALRIELEPMLARAAARAAKSDETHRGLRRRHLVLAFLAGIAISAVFADRLSPFLQDARAAIVGTFQNSGEVSQNGGISASGNEIE